MGLWATEPMTLGVTSLETKGERMNKERLIKVLGWIAWIAVGVAIATALLGAQTTPSTPSLFAYTIALDQGGTVVCVVADHYAGLAIDYSWDKP